MNYEIHTTSLDRLAARIPAASPVFMLNLLRFRPDGGRETYFGNYLPAFNTLVAAHGIEGIVPIWIGEVAGFVAGPDGKVWDAAAIIRYPSFDAFRAIVESHEYRDDVAPHRLAAVVDWRLIAQTEMAQLS